jgi:two-component system response regulator FixJ
VDDLSNRIALIAHNTSVVDSTLRIAAANSWQLQHFETCEIWLRQVVDDLSWNGAVPSPLQTGCVLVQTMLSSGEAPNDLTRVCSLRAGLPVVILTHTPTVDGVVAAMRAGANNLIEFPYSDEQYEQVIRRALKDSEKMYPTVIGAHKSRLRLSRLSSGEEAVLEKLLEGSSNKAIASTLKMGLRTVELRRARLLQKMGAKNLAELVRLVCESRALPC